MKHRFFLSLCLFLVCSFALYSGLAAQRGTLHLIASIDNINEDIREGCAEDFALVNKLFSATAKEAGMDYNLQRLPFNSYTVTAYIESFRCGPQDVVVFLFSGHGVRYGEEDEEEWPWPYLYYCQKSSPDNYLEDCEIDLEWVQSELIAKNPRMSIVLGDNCNDVQDDDEMNEYLSLISEMRDDWEASGSQSYTNLGLIRNFRGHIIASAASPGQAAFTNPGGSYFIAQFFHFLLEALTASTPTTWNEILGKTKHKVKELSGGKQTPMFNVDDH